MVTVGNGSNAKIIKRTNLLKNGAHVQAEVQAIVLLSYRQTARLERETARHQAVFPMSIIWLQSSQVSEANLIPPDQTPSVTQEK